MAWTSEMTPRESAYRAYLLSLKEEAFISKALPETDNPALAYEIAQGTCRMARALDHIATALSEKKVLKLKLKEKALLRIALYQLFYLGNSPKHAIGDESIKLAKKFTSTFFAKFLNALIRKSIDYKKEDLLPQGDDEESLSIRNSFPTIFIAKLIKAYGHPSTKQICTALNTPPKVMARKLGTADFIFPENLEIAKNSAYYIQNITPALLMQHLFTHCPIQPDSILDLCSAPGGKLIRARELFPKASLYANDVSEEKCKILSSNLEKYGIEAHISTGKGEDYSEERLFDLILLDVPCSNSGVFHKKPEARWRLSPESIKALNAIQVALINKARKLLKPHGKIWYMTCSILPDENLDLVKKFNAKNPLTIIPENDRDGGFGCVIT